MTAWNEKYELETPVTSHEHCHWFMKKDIPSHMMITHVVQMKLSHLGCQSSYQEPSLTKISTQVMRNPLSSCFDQKHSRDFLQKCNLLLCSLLAFQRLKVSLYCWRHVLWTWDPEDLLDLNGRPPTWALPLAVSEGTMQVSKELKKGIVLPNYDAYKSPQ